MRRISREMTFLAILFFLLFITGCASNPDVSFDAGREPGTPIPKSAKKTIVVRVVDGDTFVIEGKKKVRLIGINTPESVDPRRPVQYYGKEASAYTKKLLKGKRVWIQNGKNPRDKYGRILAWVWLENGTFVNGELVRQGYAQVYTFPDNPDYADYLLELQRQAKKEKRGLWGKAL